MTGKRKKIKVDLHLHTSFSRDSSIEMEELYKRCMKLGISKVAITDHNEIKGALKMKEKYPDFIIVGEEIMTKHGEIIGLFLKELIKPQQSAKQTIKQIKKQGGAVYIPHPFDKIRCNISSHLDEIKDDIDIIEVFNSKVFFNITNKKALKYAEKNGFLKGAGSDAHALNQLGNTYIKMDDFNTKEEFLKSLKKNTEIVGTKTTLSEFIRLGVFYLKQLSKSFLKKRLS